jgi:hypothetical protein
MKKFAGVLFVIIVGACAHLPAADPSIRGDWNRTLYNARRDADAGNYFAADKLLDEFVRLHPDTRDAREIAFWKAAYMVDPANSQGSLAGGIAALDGYLATADSTGRYAGEARVLRRTAAAAQAINVIASRPSGGAQGDSSSAAAKDTVVVVSKSREEEIATLKDQLAKSKDELAKVSAELDRIKKRLANPDK